MAKRIESDNVMDILSLLNQYAHSFDWNRYEIAETTHGFCCDSGHYSTEESLENLSEVYWTLVNFGGDTKHAPTNHFAIEYTEKGNYGNIDDNYPVTVFILDNDCGEYTNRYYEITKK